MRFLTGLNSRLSRWGMYVAALCLMSLLIVVLYGVLMRYAFNDAPPYVEQVALLLVISVAMFGAASGVRDCGHIGLDSLVEMLPLRLQFICKLIVYVLSILFASSLLFGGYEMAVSTLSNTIPTLGISEATRYVPVISAGFLIILFSIEHMVAMLTSRKVVPSWH